MDILRLILSYTFSAIDQDQRSVIPVAHKITGLAPILIKTAHSFATNPNLDKLVQDDNLSEFMVNLIEILVLLSDEREYFEIFVQN